MKEFLLAVATLYALVASAVPHGESHQPRLVAHKNSPGSGDNHRHQHAARRVDHLDRDTDFSTVTDVVTVTASNAVVWVDQFANVISTKFHDFAAPTAMLSSSDDTLAAAPTSFTPPAAPTSEVDSSGNDNIATAAAAVSSTPAVSIDHPSSNSDPYSVPLTAADPDTTTTTATTSAGSISAVSGVAPASDDRIQNTGNNGGDAAKAGNSGNSGNTGASNTAGGGFGIDYELIGSNGCKTQSEMNSEFPFIASQGFSKIRFYDIGCDLSVATAAASAAGLQVTLGLNTIGDVAGDLATLIGMIKGNWGPVDTVVIGNEVVNSGGDPNAVASAVTAAVGILQGAGFTKNVVAVDAFDAHTKYPQICQASSYCAVNAHAYFDPSAAAGDAGTWVQKMIAPIISAHPDKAVIVTESGWPYQGNANGAAIPSVANQQAAISSLKSAFASNPGGLFLFQAYDAYYKSPGPLGVEQFFGIYGH